MYSGFLNGSQTEDDDGGAPDFHKRSRRNCSGCHFFLQVDPHSKRELQDHERRNLEAGRENTTLGLGLVSKLARFKLAGAGEGGKITNKGE
jgi:hypothetical protein